MLMFHTQVEKADEDFVLPDGVAIEEDVDGDAATEGDETPEDAFEPADDEPAAEVLDNADAEEDLTDEEEAGASRRGCCIMRTKRCASPQM